MKPLLLFLLLTCLLLTTHSFKNTTDFYKRKLNETEIYFQSFAGYQNITWRIPNNTGQMFYQLFGATKHDVFNASDIVPLTLWVMGGPGFGAQLSTYRQISPIKITNGQVKHNTHPWNILSHLVFIDSPLNTGFSKWGDRQGKIQVNTTDDAAKDLFNFLYNLYQQFPALKQSPLYLGGQSFAAHYLPYLARLINSNMSFYKETKIIVKGVLFGGGWVDPKHQLNYYDSYLWSVGIAQGSFRQQLTWHQTHATINIFGRQFENSTNLLNFIIRNQTTHQKYMGNISTWNFRNYNGIDHSFIQFLQSNKIQFGVNVDYINFNQAIYQAFKSQFSQSKTTDLVYLLDFTKVLIFQGQNDVIVNNGGVMSYINNLHWSWGIQQWKRTIKTKCSLYGVVLGWAKVWGNLWYVHINGAGHMASQDKPQATFVMFGHFLRNQHDWDH